MAEELKNQPNSSVRFLDDTPLPKDDLDLHKNIAETIKKNIELIKDNKKKVIGLFGSWGSGKSTVIEILKKDIGENKVFIFDSWSHKGDFLKRAFLLELAINLGVEKEEYNVEKEEHKKKEKNKNKLTIKKILTRKLIEKLIETNANLNFITKILSIILFLSILISAISKILEYFVLPYYQNYLATVTNFLNNYKFITIISIIVMLILLFIIIEPIINFYFLKKVNINESHTTKEDLEFTNYDYKNYLTYILNKANLNKEEPFIIVFDNLDRVDDETVLNTLSLIQLTNESLSDKNDEKNNFNNIYFIIPIDKERLEKTIKTIIAGSSNNNFEKEKYAKDFLEKIFPYKINIPNIKHSNWRKFFSDMIQKSFDSHINEDDISFIRRVFEKSIINSKFKNLTPREIKNFINNLVENYLYWENLENQPDIKLQSIYIALHNYFSNEFKERIENFDKLKSCIENNNSIEDNNSKCKFKYILEIAKEEFSDKEITETLLKQYYKVEEIYSLFIDTSIQAIESEKTEELKDIVGLFDDKYKVENLLDEIWNQKDEFRKNINLLLQFYKAVKAIGFHYKYKNKISQTLIEITNNLDNLSKLEKNHLNKFEELLRNEEKLMTLFIKKSVEIITTIPEEGENETNR